MLCCVLFNVLLCLLKNQNVQKFFLTVLGDSQRAACGGERKKVVSGFRMEKPNQDGGGSGGGGW